MSLRVLTQAGFDLSFPRVSGDEPYRQTNKSKGEKFSPRERG